MNRFVIPNVTISPRFWELSCHAAGLARNSVNMGKNSSLRGGEPSVAWRIAQLIRKSDEKLITTEAIEDLGNA